MKTISRTAEVTRVTITDPSITRDHCMGTYEKMCLELIEEATGLRIKEGSCRMSWDEFTMWSVYEMVTITLDFNNHLANIIIKRH